MNTVTRLTAHQIIDETIEYYTKNPRSFITDEVGDTTCCYLTDEGAMCAVGRCLTEDALKIIHQVHEGNSAYHLLDTDEFQLKPQYEGQSKLFWTKLQKLHDGDTYWDKDGLSCDGKEYVKKIKIEFVDK